MVTDPVITESQRTRFWTKVDKRGPDECWPWLGYVNPSGYGMFGIGSKKTNDVRMRGAYRIAYRLVIGPVPKGRHLDHLCRNRACCNPTHLEPVTRVENVLRGTGAPAQNARKTHCKYGHELTPENLRPGLKKRSCLECERRRGREAYELRKLTNPYVRKGRVYTRKTHCIHGHEFTPENTYTRRDGKRKCRACAYEQQRERYALARLGKQSSEAKELS